MTAEIVDTKLEAFKLITDPTRLLSLIFSKYGEIQEDFYIEISNQLIFNKLTHFNIYFKEYNTFYDDTENIRRLYTNQESRTKISKLNEYYKNYQLFFCKPFISDIIISNLLKNYQDTKAEIFYKKHYGDSSSNKEENEQSKIIHNSSSLSSLDNITYNKTIFDQKYKNIIENCDKSNNSLILTLDSYLNNKNEDSGLDKGNLISVNSSCSNNEKDRSFVDCLNNLILFYKNKIIEKPKNSEENNKNKNNNLKNICKDINDKIKTKILNKTGISDKQNKENNKNQNLIPKPKLPNLIKSPIHKKNNSKDKKDSFNEKKYEKGKIKTIKENNSKNEKNLLLSPNTKKFNFTNLTSRISEFKKFKPINIKDTKRNKSYHLNNNKNNDQMVSYNKSPNSNNNISFPHNNQKIEMNLKNINDNSNKNIKIIKSNNSQISIYNQFLKGNNNLKKNPKNITHELLNKGKKIKNLSNKNIIFNQYKKLANSPRQNHKIEINNNNNFKSNFNLFKSGNLSPSRLNPINKHNNKRSLNILQTYNKFINQTKSIEQHKKFIISSNSIDNNIHVSSLSPKSLSSNIRLNKSKNKSNIQNCINIINKINLPNSHHKNSMRNSNNNNYNINFNNLFFYGPNTPMNFDNIRNNIIYNPNKNLNIHKINANFYMLSFNNLNNSNQMNSRNKIKVKGMNNNNSLYKIKYKTNNNTLNAKNLRKCESQKRYTNYKKRGLNLNEKKIPFTINKILFDK